MEVTGEGQHNHNGLETLLFLDAVNTSKSVLIALSIIWSYCLA